MIRGKYLSGSRLQRNLLARTDKYAVAVGAVYRDYMQKVIDLVKGTELEDGKPFSFLGYGYGDDVTRLFRQMYSSVYQLIRTGVEKEWILSNKHNDDLVKSIFGEKSISDNHFARYFKHNMDAMDAFFARKSKAEGLSLSQRVWKYTGSFREELENALDLAIGEGLGAKAIARKVKIYLNEPDRLYRRFRVKIGEDEAGNPIYGRKWKRRIYDKETLSYKWIDDNPRYKPGKGIYRSSIRNAQRLARTETNIAYRSANYERWQQLDFIVGFEIRRSNNPYPCIVCESMKGVYPKNFKWTGWHPNCRCYMIPVLAKQEEVDDAVESILNGDDEPITDSVNAVKEYPFDFQQWIKENEHRINIAKGTGKLPYFIKDNPDIIKDILNPLTPEQKHHVKLVKKYGDENVQKLYNAFDSFKNKISSGDLAYQIKKLEFEIDWVAKKNKYITSPEMVKMLKKELAIVKDKQELQNSIDIAQGIIGYKSKSKHLNDILSNLNIAISSGDTKLIQELTVKAQEKIYAIDKARLSKLSKKLDDGSVVDLFATNDEKLELARRFQDYEKNLKKYGSQWDSTVNFSYKRYAEYRKDLAEKYLHKQGKLVKLNGETDEIAKKALKDYLNSPFNNDAMTPVGGNFYDSYRCIEKVKIKNYSKQTGIPTEELGLISRYTYGSKWCNTYLYGGSNDYGGLVQKFTPAANSVLEKLPRYNGITFSGIDFSAMDLDKYIHTMKEYLKSGKEYVNKAFISSTTDIKTTEIFGRNCQLVIHGSKGVDVRKFSHYPTEDEIIFRAGSKFKVLAVYQEKTRKYGFGTGWVIELLEL